MPRLIRFPAIRSDEILVIAGPYRDRVLGTYGVRLTEDRQFTAPTDYHFPIPDFSTPSQERFEELLAHIIQKADQGQVIYVGCMGGIGRTGMVLAGLRRVLCKKGGDEAINWVRANYLHHAVETRAQEQLVRTFDVAAVRRRVVPFRLGRCLGKLIGQSKEAGQ